MQAYTRQAYLVATIIAAALLLADATYSAAVTYGTSKASEAEQVLSRGGVSRLSGGGLPLISLVHVMCGVVLQPFMSCVMHGIALGNAYVALGLCVATYFKTDAPVSQPPAAWLRASVAMMLMLLGTMLFPALFFLRYVLHKFQRVKDDIHTGWLLTFALLPSFAVHHIYEYWHVAANGSNPGCSKALSAPAPADSAAAGAGDVAGACSPVLPVLQAPAPASSAWTPRFAFGPACFNLGGTRLLSRRVAADPDLQLGLVYAEGIRKFMLEQFSSRELSGVVMAQGTAVASCAGPTQAASSMARQCARPAFGQIGVHELMLSCRGVFREYFPVAPCTPKRASARPSRRRGTAGQFRMWTT